MCYDLHLEILLEAYSLGWKDHSALVECTFYVIWCWTACWLNPAPSSASKYSKRVALICVSQAGWWSLWLRSSASSFISVIDMAVERRTWDNSPHLIIQDFWRSAIHMHLFPKSIIGHYFIFTRQLKEGDSYKVVCFVLFSIIMLSVHVADFLSPSSPEACVLVCTHYFPLPPCWQSLLYICGRKMRCCMAWK